MGFVDRMNVDKRERKESRTEQATGRPEVPLTNAENCPGN